MRNGTKHRPPPAAGLLNELATLPRRLVTALGLKDNKVPNYLDVSKIGSVYDVGQNGWGQFEVENPHTALATFAVASLLVVDARLDVLRRVIVLEATPTVAGAVEINFDIIKLAPTTVPAFTTSYSTIQGPVSTQTLGTAQIMGGTPLILPPGFGLNMDVNGMAGGDTVLARAIVVNVPVGASLPLS